MGETYNCELCLSNAFVKLQDYTSKDKIFSCLSIVECTNCKFKSVYPLPKEEEIKAYNSNFFVNAYSTGKTNDISELFLSSISKCRVNYIKENIEKNKKYSDVLEIGPGKSHLYDNFKKNFEFKTYSAIETDKSLHQTLKSKNITIFNTFHEIEPKKFDLIIASHVLEHIRNPNQFLKNIKKLLKDGGNLFIDIPCLDFKYKSLVEPHLYFYEKKTLIAILNKNNYKVNNISYFGKTIHELIKTPLNKNLFYKFYILLMKLNLEFLINIKKGANNSFLSNKKELMMERLFKMNSENVKKSMWIRCLVSKEKI